MRGHGAELLTHADSRAPNRSKRTSSRAIPSCSASARPVARGSMCGSGRQEEMEFKTCAEKALIRKVVNVSGSAARGAATDPQKGFKVGTECLESNIWQD